MNHQGIRQSLLFIGDITLYYLSVISLWAIDLYLRQMDSVYFADYIWGFTTFLPLFVIVVYIFDLYSEDVTMNGISLLKASLSGSILSALLAFVWLHKFRVFFYVRSILSFVIFALLIFTLFSLARRLYFALFAKRRHPLPAIVLTQGEKHEELSSEIKERPFCGLHLVRHFNVEKENISTLSKELQERKIDFLIVADECFQNKAIVHELFKSLPLQIEVMRLSSFLENLCHRVFINHIGENWFLDHTSSGLKKIHDRIKSGVDRLLALVLLISLSPLLLLLGLLVGLSSGFPIIYKQTRVGHLGKNFILYKFRTMKNDAEKNGAQWATTKDSRVTPLGKFLRKTRLDELPQLLNILKGEMSFIGPRPERPEFVGRLSENIPFYNERHLVRPGLTGWAQVSYPYGMNEHDALIKLQYDLYYIKNRSFFLELAIILKTIRVVLYRSGT